MGPEQEEKIAESGLSIPPQSVRGSERFSWWKVGLAAVAWGGGGFLISIGGYREMSPEVILVTTAFTLLGAFHSKFRQIQTNGKAWLI